MTTEMGEGIGVADVGAVLKRRAGIVAAFVAIGAVLAAATWMWSTPTYSATSIVTIAPITTDQFAGNIRPTDLINTRTESDLLRSTAVATEVRQRLQLNRSPNELLDAVEVASPDGSLTLQVTATDTQPLVAQRLADGFAAVYLDQRQENASQSIERQTATIDARIKEQRRALTTAVQVEQTAAVGTPQRSTASVEADAARSRINALEESRAQLTAVDTSPGEIAVVASRPTKPAGVGRLITALGVFVLFLVLGVLAALVRDRFDPRLRDARGVGDMVPGVPVDVLPVGSGAAAARRSDLLARLAVRVGAGPEGSPARVLLAGVGDTAPGTVAVELADTMAAAGRRTLVIWTGSAGSCPGAADTVVAALGPVLRAITPLSRALPETPGWVTWLSSAAGDDLSALLRPDAVDLLAEQACRCGYDVVLFVTPSPVSQAVALGVAHGATAVVVAAGERPRRRALGETVDLLAQVGVRPQEVVVG